MWFGGIKINAEKIVEGFLSIIFMRNFYEDDLIEKLCMNNNDRFFCVILVIKTIDNFVKYYGYQDKNFYLKIYR